MGKFNPPTNIKQIGSFDENSQPDVKIYIEDYAYTYLQQYAQAGNYNERLAFLIGKNINDDGKNVILISGAVASKYTQHDNGILNITSETWNYVYDQLEKYFSGLEVVGLMQSQPGYSSNLNDKYVSQFRNNFNKTYQTFLLCDPIENINVFHVFDQAREKLIPLKGHFIYYEKNPAMNEYMIDNKEIKKTTKEEKDEPPEITLRKRQFERIKKSNNDQRKTVNILASLCAVLFLICFIMGTGLVQNEDRISKLEEQIKNISTSDMSYQLANNGEKIEIQLNDESQEKTFESNDVQSDEVKSVFSNSSPKIVKDFSQQDDISETYDKNNKGNVDNNVQQNNLAQNNLSQTQVTDYPNNLQNDKTNSDSYQNNKKQTTAKTSTKSSAENMFAGYQSNDIPKTYVVQDGDNLSTISRKIFGTSSMVSKIMELNNMDDADKIYAGKVLKIPRG